MRIILFILIVGLIFAGLVVFSKSDSKKIQQTDNTKAVFLKIAAAGDISCPGLPVSLTQCQQKSTADLIQTLDPEIVLALGDIQYGVTGFDSYLNYYDKSWGEFKDKTKPSVGNHEYEESNAKGYFDYFNGVNNFSGTAGDRDKGYYSFEKNGWKLIALNSNCWAVGGCDKESSQAKWLENELKDQNQCQLVYFHHPLYSSGLHGMNEMVRPIWDILYKNKVELVLNGHDHLYERFALQDSNGSRSDDGIRQFVVGTGGRNLYEIKTILPNSEKRINDQFGVLELDLKDGKYDWQFISINNQVLDSGSDNCHINQASK